MKERRRRVFVVFILAILTLGGAFYNSQQPSPVPSQTEVISDQQTEKASDVLDNLEIKGRAPKTGYSRAMFGGGWGEYNGCDMRNIILKRDLSKTIVDQQNNCHVISGKLNDPYTGKLITFARGAGSSSAIQIDHVVALSDAWQKGAQYWNENKRIKFANDPLELLAVDGPANQKKGDGDAATWLPPNKSYRCRYVARQIAVKAKYLLWVTKAEYDSMKRILSKCPGQLLPIVGENEKT